MVIAVFERQEAWRLQRQAKNRITVGDIGA